MSGKRPSERLPKPGPEPKLEPRTPEQRAFLVFGSVALLAALGAGIGLALLHQAGGWNYLLLAFPLVFLVAGWGALAFGLFHLEGPRRERSVARGRIGVFGLALVLASSPLPASFLLPIHREARPFVCDSCGTRGHMEGTQNAWGSWIDHSVRLGGQAPTPRGGWSKERASCDHATSLPWR